jgi:hypothetical protein
MKDVAIKRERRRGMWLHDVWQSLADFALYVPSVAKGFRDPQI